MKHQIAEVFCVMLAFLAAVIFYDETSVLAYVFKWLSIMPLVILYNSYFENIFGYISARKYVGLKISLIPLSLVLLSIRVSYVSKINMLFIVSLCLMSLTTLITMIFYFKTKNKFYYCWLVRQILLVALSVCVDVFLLYYNNF